MDRAFAEAMKRHVDAIDLLLGAMSEHVRDHATDDVKQPMADAIFRCVDMLHCEISKPIADIYPDLHPDKDRM